MPQTDKAIPLSLPTVHNAAKQQLIVCQRGRAWFESLAKVSLWAHLKQSFAY